MDPDRLLVEPRQNIPLSGSGTGGGRSRLETTVLDLLTFRPVWHQHFWTSDEQLARLLTQLEPDRQNRSADAALWFLSGPAAAELGQNPTGQQQFDVSRT